MSCYPSVFEIILNLIIASTQLSKHTLHHVFHINFQVIEAVVNKECEEVLTAEMAKIKVEFKFFEEFNQLAEKYERKWTALDGKQLQSVLEKLDITRVIEAVGEVDAEGVNELWSVSFFLYFSQALLCIKHF